MHTEQHPEGGAWSPPSRAALAQPWPPRPPKAHAGTAWRAAPNRIPPWLQMASN